jgi:hypothetical protein
MVQLGPPREERGIARFGHGSMTNPGGPVTQLATCVPGGTGLMGSTMARELNAWGSSTARKLVEAQTGANRGCIRPDGMRMN